jgi:hypothetical protein
MVNQLKVVTGLSFHPTIMRSLFVLSLPRSLSTVIYHAARLSLQLPQPAWTTDGEILNADRIVLSDRETHHGGKYVDADRDPERFARMHALLDDVARPEGGAYKDVVNPFVAAAWLRRHDLAVLKIRRDIVDVALSMRERQWLYPAAASSERSSGDTALLEGLHRAWQAIEAVPGETIAYEDVVQDDAVLHDAVRRLYGGTKVLRARFVDEDFAARRDDLLGRRASEEFQRLRRLAISLSLLT